MAKTKTKAVAQQGDNQEADLENLPSIVIPIGPPDSGHCPTAVSTGLTPRQGAALKSLLCTLHSDNAKCEMTGYSERAKAVESYGHTVRWLLDQVANQLESELSPSKLLEDFDLVF